jgi:hypothetical protein
MSNQTNGFQRSFTGEGLKVNTVFVCTIQRRIHSIPKRKSSYGLAMPRLRDTDFVSQLASHCQPSPTGSKRLLNITRLRPPRSNAKFPRALSIRNITHLTRNDQEKTNGRDHEPWVQDDAPCA